MINGSLRWKLSLGPSYLAWLRQVLVELIPPVLSVICQNKLDLSRGSKCWDVGESTCVFVSIELGGPLSVGHQELYSPHASRFKLVYR